MSLLAKLRKPAHAGAGHDVTTIGDVLVVHAGDGGTEEARSLAASLPADPGHQVVVADLPPESPVEAWQSLAAALPDGHRPVRLVPGRRPLYLGPHVGPWLAERIARPVLAPCGLVIESHAGLFVHYGPNTGWAWSRPGRAPEWAAKRFPRPAWESAEFAEVRALGAGAVVEPLPAGVWIRPGGPDGAFERGRVRLVRTVPCLLDAPTIVLGSPGLPGLDPAEVKEFWRALPERMRATARFVGFGGLAVPGEAPFGQALADVLGTPVLCCTGIPTGSPGVPDVFAVRRDGSHGWRPFAREIAYRPGDAQPRLCAHRAPIAGLPEVAPGVYRCAPDAVVEVVEAGLWIRPPGGASDVVTARTTPLDPARNLVRYEAADPARAERMRQVAESVIGRLDYPTRLVTELVPLVPPPAETPVGAVAEDSDGNAPLSPLTRPVSMPVSGPPLSRMAARLAGIQDRETR
ncbi:hypothetical protein [Amycolatopsis sp. CA-230715]|uniref:hypothetical protein n=1 Tax=Amycolatopsis sp. CA-230715 TaxID=2745196 RepID=UPI001C009B22|nr:hypothetical protein [Amycolatopsis sp. CA-230715]QWF82739.1 hypothetical protein HUW46_06178 [Amycolatopsis sp. CA-230715]